jgi:hypothetical protein
MRNSEQALKQIKKMVLQIKDSIQLENNWQKLLNLKGDDELKTEKLNFKVLNKKFKGLIEFNEMIIFGMTKVQGKHGLSCLTFTQVKSSNYKTTKSDAISSPNNLGNSFF